MIIVFEGVDKSGKSTLSEMLASDLNYPLIKVKMIKDRNFWKKNIQLISEVMYNIMRQLQDHGHYIIDRFIVSDVVYSEIFKRDELTYFNPIKHFDNNVVFIFCCPPLRSVLARCRDQEKILKENEIRKLYFSYIKHIKIIQKKFPILHLDTSDSIKECMYDITKFLINEGRVPFQAR